MNNKDVESSLLPHDPSLAERANRTIEVLDDKIVSDQKQLINYN